jgi:hypothetical protein
MLARATWTTSTCERSGLEGVACRIESSGDVGVESISFDATSGDDVWPVVSTGGQAACLSGRGYLVSSRQISGPDDKPAHSCCSDSKRCPSMGVVWDGWYGNMHVALRCVAGSWQAGQSVQYHLLEHTPHVMV